MEFHRRFYPITKKASENADLNFIKNSRLLSRFLRLSSRRSPSPQKQVSSSSEISPDKNGIRKMIYDSEDILLSLCEENGATENAAGYINACIYKLLRIIYNSNPENDMNAFRISSEESEFLSDCIISKECADLKKRCSKNTLKITVSELSKNFPDSHSLLSLIKLNEEKIACLNKNG